MITTFLVEHPWLTTAALGALIVIGPLVGYALVGRPRLAVWLGLASTLPVLALTLVPTDRDLAVGCAIEWALPTLGAVELMANVVLVVPAGLIFGVASRRPLRVALGASALSCLIELIQAVVPALGRSCSTGDWLANTIGAALGAGVAALVLVVRRRQPWEPGR
ncbi:VanZ family protein [Euzebya sp.]|uniref:VanZ family protein n=1 Tax=Euzebya sp. TaxID=1971409 RepID=UPI0035126A9F